MEAQYMALGESRRLATRRIAREEYMRHGATAVNTVAARIRQDPAFKGIIAMIAVGVAIKLAYDLIRYWWDKLQTHPEVGGFVSGEPGCRE